MGKFTEQEIKAKAEELKLTLTDEQIKAYVLLDILPPSAEDDEPPLDDNTQAAINARIKKANDQRKQAENELKEAKKKLADFEKTQQDIETADAAKKGEWEKLQAAALEATKKAEEVIEKNKEIIRNNAISTTIKEGLLLAGIAKEHITKALKLFDTSKVIFTWSNEENLEYEISDVSKLVEDFQKENPFFFSIEETTPFVPGSPPTQRKPKASTEEERVQKLEKKFPALRF